MQIETIANDNNKCGEGPIWDHRSKRLVWNDLSSSLVYQYSPSTGHRDVISRGLMAAGIALNRDGTFVFGGADGLHVWESQGKFRTILSEHGGEKLNINDLVVGPGGRVYFGTVYWGAAMEKPGKLYIIDPDKKIRVVADDIEMSNGLGFSPDDRIFYFADTSKRVIYRFDVDPKTGDLTKRRVFVKVPDNEGIPDGLTVDADGFIWSAQWYGSQVVRYDPDGKVERRIKMPAQQISSVAIGGADLTDLYITSAGESWPSSYAPPGYNFDAPNIGGALYRVRLDGVRGRAEHIAAL